MCDKNYQQTNEHQWRDKKINKVTTCLFITEHVFIIIILIFFFYL